MSWWRATRRCARALSLIEGRARAGDRAAAVRSRCRSSISVRCRRPSVRRARASSPTPTRASPSTSRAGPLLRAQLLRLAARGARAAAQRASHRLRRLVDGRAVAGALERLQRVRRMGSVPDLPALPIQYADYAVWQREWLQGEVLEQQLAYWKEQLADLSDAGVAHRPAAPAGAQLPRGTARL